MKNLNFKCVAASKQDNGTTLINLISTDGKQVKASSIVLRLEEGDERIKDFKGGDEGSEHIVSISTK